MAPSLAAAVLAQTLSVAAASQCSFDLREGTCFSGDNMKKVQVSDVAACCSACEAEPNCTHFTFSGSSSCGLKTGAPVAGSHTHCTSGARAGPEPQTTLPPQPTSTSAPAPSPTPSPPTPPPTPTPTPPSPPAPTPPGDHSPINGVTYEAGGKCLQVTGQQQHNRFFHVTMGDCGDSKASWAEGFSHTSNGNRKGNYQPQVQAKVGGQETCLSAPDHCGGNVRTWICSSHTNKEKSHNRMIWDSNLNLLRSNFCIGKCVDLNDAGNPVLKTCSEVQTQWTRHGPTPRPTVVRENPGPAGPMSGRYYLTWPLPQVNGFTVAGTGDDGYPEYFGAMNGEVCPHDERHDVDGEWRCNYPRKSEVPLWKSPKHRADGGVNHPMKRSHILQRAIVWVANHFDHKPKLNSSMDESEELQSSVDDNDVDLGVSKHSNCAPGRVCNVDGCAEGEGAYCPQFFHGGACCATVGNAWNASTNNCFRSHKTSIRVPCDQMRPGDAISRNGGEKTCDTCKDFPGADHNHIVVFRKWENAEKTWMTVFSDRRYSSMPRYTNMYCMKRKNVIEDIEGDTQWEEFDLLGDAAHEAESREVEFMV